MNTQTFACKIGNRSKIVSVLYSLLLLTNLTYANNQNQEQCSAPLYNQTSTAKTELCKKKYYQSIIFDLGGVLATFSVNKTIARMRAEGKTIPDEVAEKIALLHSFQEHRDFDRGTLSREDYFLKVTLKMFQDEKYLDLVSEILDGAQKDLKLDDQGILLLNILKQFGYKVYLLSNMNATAQQYIINQSPDFFSLFDGVTLSYQVKAVKPEPAIYRALLETYKLNPEECLFLDDLEGNIEAGKQMGIDGIVFKNAAQALTDLMDLNVLPKMIFPAGHNRDFFCL